MKFDGLWNTSHELFIQSEAISKQLVFATCKYLNECFKLQDRLLSVGAGKKPKNSTPEKWHLHPFSQKMCSTHGFGLGVFKLMCLPEKMWYTMDNECGGVPLNKTSFEVKKINFNFWLTSLLVFIMS
jgi:hypothetical protein